VVCVIARHFPLSKRNEWSTPRPHRPKLPSFGCNVGRLGRSAVSGAGEENAQASRSISNFKFAWLLVRRPKALGEGDATPHLRFFNKLSRRVADEGRCTRPQVRGGPQTGDFPKPPRTSPIPFG